MTAVMNQTFQCTYMRLIIFLSVQFSTGCSKSTGRKTIESHLCAMRSSDRVYFLVCAFSKSPLVSSEMALFCFFSGPPHQSQNTIKANMNETKLFHTQQRKLIDVFKIKIIKNVKIIESLTAEHNATYSLVFSDIKQRQNIAGR